MLVLVHFLLPKEEYGTFFRFTPKEIYGLKKPHLFDFFALVLSNFIKYLYVRYTRMQDFVMLSLLS